MEITKSQLQKLFPNYDEGPAFQAIYSVQTDSREQMPNSLFIPIVGERFNAHDYIEQAIENGAVASLWDKRYALPEKVKHKCNFFYVDHTVEAMQDLANFYRKEINPIVIGITGSNGKTTTKDLVASVLETTYKTHKTAGNFNNDIGLPLTILTMPQDTEVLVLEMGMNDFGEIKRLSEVALPDYAIITNIGESHIEYLGSREGIAKAKLEIVEGLKNKDHLIVDGDEALLSSLTDYGKVTYCSFVHKDQAFIEDITVDLNKTTFRLGESSYEIPLTGKHHAKNASYAIMLARMLGIDEGKIKAGLQTMEYSQMRFELKKTKEGATIINDAYNASPTSMMGAIDIMKSLEAYQQKIVVLGDIFELGSQAKYFHEKIGRMISSPIDLVFTFGENAKYIAQAVDTSKGNILVKHFTEEETLITQIKSHLDQETVILFKASRGMAFEGLVKQLLV